MTNKGAVNRPVSKEEWKMGGQTVDLTLRNFRIVSPFLKGKLRTLRAGLWLGGLERDATQSRLVLPLRNFTPSTSLNLPASIRDCMNPASRLYPLKFSSKTEPTGREVNKAKCSPLCTTPDPK